MPPAYVKPYVKRGKHPLPAGYVQKGDTCVKKPVVVVACTRGKQRIFGKCIKKPEVSSLCKRIKLVGKSCVRIPVTKVCGAHQKLVRGDCVTRETSLTQTKSELRRGRAAPPPFRGRTWPAEGSFNSLLQPPSLQFPVTIILFGARGELYSQLGVDLSGFDD